ncbi:MAG: two-component sensor histidine kinase [Pseudorhodobacter sp. PARRP1]|nr:MAG: two-component sensor histidine kinase [Pseudorhodobacter sp. PARRP1]
MSMPRSLQARLALLIGLCVTLLWAGAATLTATLLRYEMDEVFDSTLQETAQRILPLAVRDIVNRDEEGVEQQIAPLRNEDEYFTYVVRDARGRLLLTSHAADTSVFPPFDGVGFRQTATHRLYFDAALQGTITIAVAEPLDHRAMIAREMQLGLGLPLLVVIPLSLAAIFVAVRMSFAPVRRLRDALALRGPRDLSALPKTGLPSEVAPIAAAVNQLLARLGAAFEAERSFAANAAHELRTPVAGAIAQAQRLQTETKDPEAARRGAEIETALKRLIRLSEKMMQLARAEGGRLRGHELRDLRPVLGFVVDEFARSMGANRLELSEAETPVLSDLDPDIFGILIRNLIENALKHGAAGSAVRIGLTAQCVLTVANEGPPIAPETLTRLTSRFERGSGAGDGSGLGLTIVRTIAERADCTLTLTSPIAGQASGFVAAINLSGAGAGQSNQAD